MTTVEILFGIILCVMAAALVTCVLLQSGKEKSLSGTITGGAGDSYFGKSKGKTKEKVLSKVTTLMAVIFAIMVVVLYVISSVIR